MFFKVSQFFALQDMWVAAFSVSSLNNRGQNLIISFHSFF